MNRNRFVRIVFVFLTASAVFLSGAALGHAAIFYLSPTGNDASGDGSAANPWKTFSQAFQKGGGNTYLLESGTYNYSGCEVTAPPSGTAAAYTIIKAQTDGGAVFTTAGSLAVPNTVSYVQFEGLKWSFPAEKSIHGNHLKFLRCAFQGGSATGNVTNTVVGTNDTDDTNYILLEDCWFYGLGGRYNLLVYNSDKVIVRRCVIRHEGGWDDQGNGDPESGINIYNSSNCLVENVIVIDSLGTFKTFSSSFYAVKNTSSARANMNNSWLGCIALGSENMGMRVDTDLATNLTFQDDVFWDCKNGGISFGSNSNTCTVNRMTIGRTLIGGSGDFMGGLGFWGSGGGRTAQNLVLYGLAGSDLTGVAATYFDTYGNGSQSSGTGRVTYSPLTSGLKYLPEIETGSALKTAGAAGGQMGAQIVNQWGTSGTLYGDAGYDALTAIALWPWPNQVRIAQDMCQGKTTGFCGSTSLTDYIWSYLGSPSPYAGGGSNPPVLSGFSATPSVSSATVAWSTDKVANSQVEYGLTTAYGSLTTLDGSMVTAHSEAMTGLSAATLYHCRVRSTDASGNLAVSGDYTFTTRTNGAPPVLSAVAAAPFVSSATVSWTTNVGANSQVEYGLTASYGASTTLNSSLVTAHTQALAGLSGGTLYHFRVHSADAAGNPAVSADFTFTTLPPPDVTPPVLTAVSAAPFLSSATVSWTTDEGSDSQVDYGMTVAYGGSTTLNTSLVTAHSQALPGLSAGTLYHYRVRSKDASGNPAVSGDSVFTTLQPPDVTPPTISAVAAAPFVSGATVTWTTSEMSDSQVDYGLTAAYGNSTALNAGLVVAHSRPVGGLSAGTLYHYRVRSKDAAGNPAVSGDYNFITSSATDTTPPTISAIAAVPYASSATVSWTTNEGSDSQVDYGPTAAYGLSTALNSTLLTAHVQLLNGLSGATVTHYRVRSEDAAGNLAVSNDSTFTTLPIVDVTPPVIGPISAVPFVSSATVSWTTDEVSDSQVDYGLTAAYGISTALNAVLVTAHSQVLSGISAATLYHFRVHSKDAAGNPAVSGDYTFTTRALSLPPVLSAISASPYFSTATVTWVTDKAADSQVEYGLTAAYGALTTLNASLVTAHSQGLSGLSAGTQYHYRVRSKDSAGNVTVSGDLTFLTLTGAGVAPLTINSATAVDVTAVDVLFSRPVDPGSAANIDNYAVNRSVEVTAAALAADQRTVHLTTSANDPGVAYTLMVNNVMDLSVPPVAIAPGTKIVYTYSTGAGGREANLLKPPKKYLIPRRGVFLTFGPDAEEVIIYSGSGLVVFRGEKSDDQDIVWDGRDRSGRIVETGVYVCKIKGESGAALNVAVTVLR